MIVQIIAIGMFFLVDLLVFRSFNLVHIFFIALLFSFSILAFFKSLEHQLHMDILLKKEDIINGHIMKNSKDLLKHQRHDYMNLFQIVYGYLQLDRRDKALNQIKWINSMASSISKVYRLSIFSISMLLEEKIKKADNYSVKLEYNVYSELNESLRTIKNENYIIEKIDNILDIIIEKANEQKEENIISIEIHEYEDSITFILKSKGLKTIIESIKNIYPYAIVEYNIVKIKLKYREPRGLYIDHKAPVKPNKSEFKSINLRDYL